MTRAQELAEVEAKIAGARSEYGELVAARRELETEIERLELLHTQDLKRLSAAEIRAAIQDLVRAESELPRLKKAHGELARRVEAAAVSMTLLDKQRRRVVAAVAAEEAAELLNKDSTVEQAIATLDKALAIFPKDSKTNRLAEAVQLAQRDLRNVLRTAATL